MIKTDAMKIPMFYGPFTDEKDAKLHMSTYRNAVCLDLNAAYDILIGLKNKAS
jgi:hypothetical protein